MTIVLESSETSVELPAGASLFEAGARVQAAIDGQGLPLAGSGAEGRRGLIDTACVGKGTCGLCRIKILAGAEHLVPYTDEERKHLGNVYHITKVRLACRAKLEAAQGEVKIQVVRRKK